LVKLNSHPVDGSSSYVDMDWSGLGRSISDYPELKERDMKEVCARAVKVGPSEERNDELTTQSLATKITHTPTSEQPPPSVTTATILIPHPNPFRGSSQLMEDVRVRARNFDSLADEADVKVEGEQLGAFSSSVAPGTLISISSSRFVDMIPILQVGDICWTPWKIKDKFADKLFESIIVDVHTMGLNDVIYDIYVIGDAIEGGRYFKIGFEEVMLVEDYEFHVHLKEKKGTDVIKMKAKEGGGWSTKLTGDKVRRESATEAPSSMYH